MKNLSPKNNSSRVCIRLPCELQAEVTFSGGGIQYTRSMLISNISTTGIQILSPSFIATGQTVSASFKVPGQNEKATLQAEVMRVESLQRRGNSFPYALGARFTASPEANEKQITHFILHKMSCVILRRIAAGVFFTLSLIEFLRVLNSFVSISGQYVIWDALTVSALPVWLAGCMALGFFSSATLTWLNQRSFPIHGFFWSGIELIAASIYLGTNFHFLESGGAKLAAWIIGAAIWAFSAAAAGLSIYLIWRMRKNQKMLFSEKISLKPNQPSFTIL